MLSESICLTRMASNWRATSEGLDAFLTVPEPFAGNNSPASKDMEGVIPEPTGVVLMAPILMISSK